MIASLQKHALPFAVVLLCAMAMYIVYRDMRKMEARLARIDAAVASLTGDGLTGEEVLQMFAAPVCPMPQPQKAAVVEDLTEHAPAEPEAAIDPAAIDIDDGMDDQIADVVTEAMAAEA